MLPVGDPHSPTQALWSLGQMFSYHESTFSEELIPRSGLDIAGIVIKHYNSKDVFATAKDNKVFHILWRRGSTSQFENRIGFAASNRIFLHSVA